MRKLRRADELTAESKTGEEIAAELGISAATLYNWRRVVCRHAHYHVGHVRAAGVQSRWAGPRYLPSPPAGTNPRDRKTGVLVENSARFPGATLGLPDDLWHGGRCRVATRRYLLCYDFDIDSGTITVRIDCAADQRGPAITGALTLYVEGAAPPLSLSAKLTSSIDYYTFKQPFPVGGTLTVGDRTYAFERARDFAILDEHRSQFPYSTLWTWGTFAVAMTGGVVGSNFAQRQELSDDDDESSNWVPGAAEPLAGVQFDVASDDPLSTVRIRDRDGRLDVLFTPAGRKAVKANLVVAAIDYWQLAGTYRGAVTSLAGESYSFDDVPGILERMKTRF